MGRRPGPVGRHLRWDAASGEVPDLGGADVVVHCAAAVGDPAAGSAAEAAMRAVNVTGTNGPAAGGGSGAAGGVGQQRQRVRAGPRAGPDP